MGKQIIYQEFVPAHFMVAIFSIIARCMGFNLYYQINYGPIGSRPAPNIFYAIGAPLAVLFGLNFSAIRIRLTAVDVHVSFDLFGKTLAWKDAATCEIGTSSVVRYGGWGVRFGIIHGKPNAALRHSLRQFQT